MTLRLILLGFSQMALLTAAEAPDLLRFTNGDQLHGTFQGIKSGGLTTWQRDDLTEPIDFKSTLLRHVVLRSAKPLKPLMSLSSVSLVNGDRIPGAISAMDDKSVTLKTSFSPDLVIPRDQVTMLSPSPLGGRLHYYGPFSEDGWKMATATFPDGLPAATPQAAEAPQRWLFSGSSWFWPGKLAGTALLRENALPERASVRFDLAWKNQLFVAIGFHADFVKPKAATAEDPPRRPGGLTPGDPTALPMLFGNSYVLQIFSTHLTLFRTSVSEEGKGSFERIQINGNPLRIGDTGKVSVEIRSNRPTGEVALFINDEFVVQWNDPLVMQAGSPLPHRHGTGLGFLVQTNEAPVRISDLTIAEWNGLPDSARSMQLDEQDVILLTNGTDRFSGHVSAFNQGEILVDSKLGKFQIPLTEIAEIRFAKNHLASAAAAEATAGNLTIRFSPFGQISGRVLTGNASTIDLVHPAFGETSVQLDSAVMLEFRPPQTTNDDWDVEF